MSEYKKGTQEYWSGVNDYQGGDPEDVIKHKSSRIKELEAELKRTLDESIEVIHDQGAKIIVLESAMREFVEYWSEMCERLPDYSNTEFKFYTQFKQLLNKG